MSNMSYCRFRNTYSDMGDCIDALNEGESISHEECSAGRGMFTDILDFCVDEGIIAEYDEGALGRMFDKRDREEEDED